MIRGSSGAGSRRAPLGLRLSKGLAWRRARWAADSDTGRPLDVRRRSEPQAGRIRQVVPIRHGFRMFDHKLPPLREQRARIEPQYLAVRLELSSAWGPVRKAETAELRILDLLETYVLDG